MTGKNQRKSRFKLIYLIPIILIIAVLIWIVGQVNRDEQETVREENNITESISNSEEMANPPKESIVELTDEGINVVASLDAGGSNSTIEEATMRAEQDSLYKDADSVAYKFFVAKYNRDAATMEELYLKDTDWYVYFTDTVKPNFDFQENGIFEEDVLEIEIDRFTSLMDEEGRLYYSFKPIVVQGKIPVRENMTLKLDDSGEWKVELDGTEAPVPEYTNGLANYGETTSRFVVKIQDE